MNGAKTVYSWTAPYSLIEVCWSDGRPVRDSEGSPRWVPDVLADEPVRPRGLAGPREVYSDLVVKAGLVAGCIVLVGGWLTGIAVLVWLLGGG